MVELTSSTALPNQVAASFRKWSAGEAVEVVARCVSEPSKKTRTLLASNQARTSDIRIMVGVVEAVEAVATTTGVDEEVAADAVAMVARMKTVNIKINSTVGTTEVVDNVVAAIREVEAEARATKEVGDTTTIKEVVAIIAAGEATRIVAAETVGTTGVAATIKASNSVRLVIHLRMQSANSNSERISNSRCDCSSHVFAKPQRKNKPTACEVH